MAGNLNFKLRIVFWNIFILEIWRFEKRIRSFWKKATFNRGVLLLTTLRYVHLHLNSSPVFRPLLKNWKHCSEDIYGWTPIVCMHFAILFSFRKASFHGCQLLGSLIFFKAIEALHRSLKRCSVLDAFRFIFGFYYSEASNRRFLNFLPFQ